MPGTIVGNTVLTTALLGTIGIAAVAFTSEPRAGVTRSEPGRIAARQAPGERQAPGVRCGGRIERTSSGIDLVLEYETTRCPWPFRAAQVRLWCLSMNQNPGQISVSFRPAAVFAEAFGRVYPINGFAHAFVTESRLPVNDLRHLYREGIVGVGIPGEPQMIQAGLDLCEEHSPS